MKSRAKPLQRAGKDRRGEEGRRWALNEGGLNAVNMCNQFIKAMDYTINNFQPSETFSVHTTKEFIGQSQPDNCMGIDFGKVDVEKIRKEIV